MAIVTKRHIVEECRYEAYGELPGFEAKISENFTLRLVNNAIADLALKSAQNNYALEGVMYADDMFTLNYTNIALSADPIYGLKMFTMPALPVGLGRQRGITVFPATGGVNNNLFKMTSFERWKIGLALPSLKYVYCFVNDNNMYLDFSSVAKIVRPTAVNLSLVTSGANDLTEPIHLTDDTIGAIKAIVIPKLKQMTGTPQDLVIDGQENLQPR